MNNKKSLILYILKILESQTDEQHVFTQTKIAEYISDAMPCDRKTVGRNIKFLIDMGYPIIKTNKGYYMDTKKVCLKEKEYILEALRKGPDCSDIDKEKLIDKMEKILNQIYR